VVSESQAIDIEMLYLQERSRVFNYLLHRTGNWHEAEDLTSETFYYAVRDLHTWQDRGIPVRAWLMRIAYVRLCRFWIWCHKKPVMPLLSVVIGIDEGRIAALADDGGIDDLLDACDTAMEWALVRAALATLQDQERRAVGLWSHQVPAKIAAAQMGCTERHYAYLLTQSMTKLSSALAGPTIDTRPTYTWGRAPDVCQEPGCTRPYYCRGMCRSHFDKHRKAKRRWAAKEAKEATNAEAR
jgi:DNA-directed RNA polymerase specialized sigma24 family protein